MEKGAGAGLRGRSGEEWEREEGQCRKEGKVNRGGNRRKGT